MLPIPNEKYDFYKPGVIVDILIIDVSEKSFNSQRIVNERVRADPSSTVKSLVVSVPLEPCSWIKSVKDLEHRTLRISITPKRLNLSKPIVRYFHFGDNDSLDLNKNKPEIAKQLPMLKVFLEHVRFTESNKKKINQFSPLKMIINNASAENSSNSSISKVDISEKSSDSKPNLLRHGKNFNINSDLNIVEQDDFYQHSRLKDKRYIDKIINSIRNVMEIKPSNIGKINANEKRNRFKRSWLSYDDLDSASNLYSTININQINRDIEQYEEGKFNHNSNLFMQIS